MRRLGVAFPYLFFGAMVLLVAWSNWSAMKPAMAMRSMEGMEGHGGMQGGMAGAVTDPVCRMQVNPGWGYAETFEGTTFHFCTERCRNLFREDPERYVRERCMVCEAAVDPSTALPSTYLGKTYYLCSAEHRQAFQLDPARYFMHTMWGIPQWMYYVSIAAVLLVSFVCFEGRPARPRRPTSPGPSSDHPDRVDLLRFGVIRRAVRSRAFRAACQLAFVAAFALILVAGLFGDQTPGLNIAPLLTWTIWWCGLVIVLLFAGKAWCYVCPWDAIATWMERLRLWRKTDQGLGLGLPWPRRLRNIWLATALFVGLTWIELGFGVTLSPRATAYLGLGMLVMTIVAVFLFERKSFCRYGCLVGRVSGLYALFAGVEIRARDRNVCRSCAGKECVRGSAAAYPCPTFENPARMSVNTYCIQCTECIQACPHDNMTVNLRPWGADLAALGKPAVDEAYLALLMLAITGFHGLTMTPAWPQLLEWLQAGAGMGEMGAFTAGMALIMGLPVLVYAVLVAWSHRIATRGDPNPVSYGSYFVRYAYCVLPIALFYHLSHNLEHLLMEGPKVVRLLSDPLGRGWNLLGTAAWKVPPLVSLDVLWLLQVVLVGVGHVYSLWAAQKISRGLFPDPARARRGQIPILVGMIAFSVFSLWLLKQPMEMRTSAM